MNLMVKNPQNFGKDQTFEILKAGYWLAEEQDGHEELCAPLAERGISILGFINSSIA